MKTSATLAQSAVYEIQVQGVLLDDWRPWFNGLKVSDDGRITTIHGRVLDQPALFGLLIKVRDLGLTLLSVQRLDDN